MIRRGWRAIIRRVKCGAVGFIVCALLPLAALGQEVKDWPQFLGPTRDGVYHGNDVAPDWPAGGPRVLWRKDIGQGWSGPVVAGAKLILFHRLGDKEVVECLEAATGNPVWSANYPTAYKDDFGFDEGPRSTPAVADGKVYTYGAEGLLHAWDLATAIGAPYTMDEDAAVGVLSNMQQMLKPEMRGEGKAFAEEVSVGPDATVQVRLLAFSGRKST